MKSLLKNIRSRVLFFSIFFALAVYIYITSTIPEGSLQTIRLTQIYALTAITYLYLALMATPLTKTFTSLPLRGQYLKARRALGVSAFFFGLLHASFAFFGQLGGIGGLGFLSSKYLLAVSLSFTALLILTAMASTSFDFMIKKLGHQRWKRLHRFVYLAGVLILIHALMLGTHFQDLSKTIPQIMFTALAILLVLESIRLDNYLQSRFLSLPRFGLTMVVVLALVITYFFNLLVPVNSSSPISLGIHAAHIQLAQQAQQAAQNTSNPTNIPGLQGDRTLRFNVQFDHPNQIIANQDVPLKFSVFYAANGAPEYLFSTVYEKPMHLVIVDDSLTYFEHIHPTQTGDGFEITTKFPSAGIYHLYIDFQPLGAIEQQFAFTLNVTGSKQANTKNIVVDKDLTKTFGGYQVTLSYPTPLKAPLLSVGKQLLTFTIKDAKSGQPITTLKPYLASFGHLVMIDVDDYQYLHVHPTNLRAPAPNSNGGPTVDFMPLGLYRPINPGVYRVFAQFNPDGKLFTADYTIEVQP